MRDRKCEEINWGRELAPITTDKFFALIRVNPCKSAAPNFCCAFSRPFSGTARMAVAHQKGDLTPYSTALGAVLRYLRAKAIMAIPIASNTKIEGSGVAL